MCIKYRIYIVVWLKKKGTYAFYQISKSINVDGLGYFLMITCSCVIRHLSCFSY